MQVDGFRRLATAIAPADGRGNGRPYPPSTQTDGGNEVVLRSRGSGGQIRGSRFSYCIPISIFAHVGYVGCRM
ncbi:hypothetical protein L1987_80724 [Smallanthus sonchifolius]|uniref:Uncharacterized protein n=1 Tax=Smallanthus sonchifolius TaxID=185202 RepID=A0ACB8YNX1_9ASTR|nr:hypothetical protein L1987_80724 [Smallanthus sonchifolius]